MPIFVVAECGVNWNSPDMACEMIKVSAESGANFVKFQLFNEATIKDSPLFNRLKPLILDEAQVKLLQTEAEALNLGFVLTPMYLEAIDMATKYADLIKIRFKDHENQEFIDKALATGKTVLISVPSRPIGALTYHPRIKWMYCLNRYPPEPEDFNLDAAACCDGFSSHYPNTIFDLAYAINRFPEEAYIEKHVMLDLPYFVAATEPSPPLVYPLPIDSAVSISFETLKIFISNLRLIERMKRTRI